MKLSTYAKEMGITRQTASRWFHEGSAFLFMAQYHKK